MPRSDFAASLPPAVLSDPMRWFGREEIMEIQGMCLIVQDREAPLAFGGVGGG